MSIIQVNNITFAYEGSYDTIFENISFQMDTDWKLGFIGRNGIGKTTFLHLLLGKYSYQGTIISPKNFSYFPFAIEDDKKTPLEIIEKLLPERQHWEISKEIALLSLDDSLLYRPFFTLSKGEQTKMLLAILFLKENSFFLLDEPTNHLDEEGQRLVAAYLKKKQGFILVSHHRDFLDQCVDHILAINKNNIQVQRGNFSSWYQNKTQEDALEIATNESIKKEIKRLTTAAKRTEAWSDDAERKKIGFDPTTTEKNIGNRPKQGAKAKKMMSRSTAIAERKKKAVEEKTALLKNIETLESMKMPPLSYHKKTLITMEKVAMDYGNGVIYSPKDLRIEQGERVALVGKNGVGKSTTLRLLYGDLCRNQGNIQRGSALKISYVPQDTSSLKGSLTQFIEERDLHKTVFLTLLRKFNFSRVQFEKNIEDFSEGQKKKLLLAGSFAEEAHLYLWDEPLNYIDIFSRIQLEESILTYKPTMVFVEHDKAFIEKVATRIISLP